ncbi:flavodoxin family protein [Clostridium folliculivorans]|uniref:Flavodoxin n=1 Tax=Clostridium folliculivorans TaxID=2886038 RepID=A0A9W5XYE5_9CLOT|nr:flavodoxin [Clostridium folliculivorans]GKU23278.1 flavodoxin [Clostridium folliculivorans]GKU29395.1 flavodoxin [Clostridium folliculivorans]
MRSLVIFYSLEGDTKFIAETISKELDGDIAEIKPVKQIPTGGFRKYLWGGKQVMFKDKPDIEPINEDLSKYDLIVLGTPVWASRFAPVFNTFLEKHKIKNKSIALFCCHSGGREGKTFEDFKEKLKGNDFLGEMAFEDPLKKDKEDSLLKAKQWIRTIKESL